MFKYLLKNSWRVIWTREMFTFLSKILSMLLFAFGAWHGIVDQDYGQACFEILLAYGCDRD